MRPTLFRPEAIAGNRVTLLGQVLEERRLPFRLVTGLSLAAALALAALCFFGEYTRKVHVAGYLAPSAGVIKLPAGQAGTVIGKQVREGQRVRQGDVLFVLSTDRASPKTPQLQAAATAAVQARLAALARERESQLGVARIQLEGLRVRLANMDGELRQVLAMIALQHDRIAAAESGVANQDHLRAAGFISAAQLDQKKVELLDQRARMGELLRSQAALEREAGGLRMELQSATMKERQEDSRHERERLQLAQEAVEAESRSAITVVAPADGVATAVLGELGQLTQAQTVLLTILPQDAALQAKLLVPSRAIGFLAVGDTVSLRYPAFPYQRFGSFKGRIVELPRSTVSGGEADLPVAQTDAMYRVSVTLDEQHVRTGRAEMPLQNGMSVEADVWVERMTLLQWIIEPLFAVAGKA